MTVHFRILLSDYVDIKQAALNIWSIALVSVKMAMSNVSLPILSETLDLFDTEVVNIEQCPYVEIVSFMIILIPVVNIPIIHSIHNDKSGTFINKLVILDCANALAHVPILFQQYQ